MASSQSTAQDVFYCDLCTEHTLQFCNSCQVSLCRNCAERHKDYRSLSHDIVPFERRKRQLAFPECQEHAGERCKGHCRDCDTPVCHKCTLSGIHRGHDAEELTIAFERKQEEIRKYSKNIRLNIIPTFQREDIDVDSTIGKVEEDFIEIENKSRNTRDLWHVEVTSIFDRILSLNLAHRDASINELQAHRGKIRDMILDMKNTLEHRDCILQSFNILKVNNYLSELKRYRGVPQRKILLEPSLRTREIEDELCAEFENFKVILKKNHT